MIETLADLKENDRYLVSAGRPGHAKNTWAKFVGFGMYEVSTADRAWNESLRGIFMGRDTEKVVSACKFIDENGKAIYVKASRIAYDVLMHESEKVA